MYHNIIIVIIIVLSCSSYQFKFYIKNHFVVNDYIVLKNYLFIIILKRKHIIIYIYIYIRHKKYIYKL